MLKNNPDWITYGPQYNTSICKNLHGTAFEKYIRKARTEGYNIMCYIDLNEKQYT